MSKVRIAVIMGGRSSEKEISLDSGRYMFQNVDENKFEKTAVFFSSDGLFYEMDNRMLVQNTTHDIENMLNDKIKISYENLANKFDLAVLATHGKYGEDGCLQGFLEFIDLPYTGSGILASAISADKFLQRKIFAQNDIKFPKFLSISRSDFFIDKVRENIFSKVKFPCVVKPSDEGCSTGISKVLSADSLSDAIKFALKWGDLVLIEEFLSGLEFTVPVLGNENIEVLAITELPLPENHGFLTLEDKFLPGNAEMITPARVSAKDEKNIIEVVKKVYKILDLKGYARIDGFLEKDGIIKITEPNTLPGATPSTCLYHSAIEKGIGPQEFIEKIIEYGIEAHQEKMGPL